MTVSPTGFLSLPPYQLGALLAAGASWQAWCTAAAVDPVAAVYQYAAPGKLRSLHAIIDHSGDVARTRDGVTVGRFIQTIGLQLYFLAKVPTGTTDDDCRIDFTNHMDAVMADLERAPTQGGTGLVINGVTLTDGPNRTPLAERDKNGDYWEAMWLLDCQVWP